MYGCKTKKSSTEYIKIDSTYINKVITVYPSSLSEIVLRDACDSLGNLRPFFIKTKIGNTLVNIKDDNGSITIVQESTELKLVDKEVFKSSNVLDKSVNVTTTTVYPKILWYSLIANLLVLSYVVLKIVRWKNSI